MNYFVILEEIETFEEIAFYSPRYCRVSDELPEYNEFEKFILAFENHTDDSIKDEYDDIISIIEHLGDNSKYLKFLRHERAAFALPTKAGFKIEQIEIQLNSKLRLYCILLSEQIVIICNGGIKTTNTAQDCPNVKPHFMFANKLANHISKNLLEFNFTEKVLDCGEDEGFHI